MSNSIITFHDKRARLYDVDLIMAVGLIIDATTKRQAQHRVVDERVESLFADWQDRLPYSLSGCLCLRLDRFIGSDTDLVTQLRELINEAKRILDATEAEELSTQPTQDAGLIMREHWCPSKPDIGRVLNELQQLLSL